jgi:pantetheine-phosphate adenylyltransferase
MTNKAVIAGSFDPITLGHLWVIKEGLALFDSIEIVIASNPAKKNLFTVSERFDLAFASVFLPEINIDAERAKKVNVNILEPTETTVGFAQRCGATHIIRGIRNTTDFEYEHQLNLINSRINDKISTVYLIPPRSLIEVSSSTVKGLAGLDGWEQMVGPYVPSIVLNALKWKVGKQKTL